MAKTIVITGAGSGLGRTVALGLGKLGHTIVLLGRTAARIEAVAAEIGGSAVAVPCDVAAPDSVRNAFSAIARTHSRIDVLVNNAGIYEPFMVADATDAQIQSSLLTNLAGPIYCTRSAIPLMARGGQIINVGSETAVQPYAMFALYQCSKAGLERFTASLHDELAPDGIRVTLLRAGQMFDETMAWNADPAALARFGAENVKRGIDVRARPISHFRSVVGLFETLLDLPADVNVPMIASEGWAS